MTMRTLHEGNKSVCLGYITLSYGVLDNKTQTMDKWIKAHLRSQARDSLNRYLEKKITMWKKN